MTGGLFYSKEAFVKLGCSLVIDVLDGVMDLPSTFFLFCCFFCSYGDQPLDMSVSSFTLIFSSPSLALINQGLGLTSRW